MIVGTGEGRQVIVSPPTGTVAVRAMPQEIAAVSQYLKTLGVNVGRQVMLEAKIIDVQLNDSQQEGINWAAFRTGGGKRLSVGQLTPGTVLQTNGALGTGANAVDPVTGLASLPSVAANPGSNIVADPRLAGGLLGLAFQTSNFAALLDFLETQGKVQVLSSPRIATINNQKAVLKVGTDDFFVTNVSTTTVTSTAGNTSSPNITVQPFFSGIALDVTPQIDEHDNVTLHVHPQVSDVKEKDKVVNLGSLGSFTLPLASSSVSEADSIVRIANSNIAAIGGLMSRQDTVVRSSIPGVGDVPILGRLFTQTSTSTVKRELVILIKPTVIREEADWVPITASDTARLRLSSELQSNGAAK
jgi:MSHA biogenesis protein MshL